MKKSKSVIVRVDPSEVLLWKLLAAAQGLTVSAAIRDAMERRAAEVIG